MRLLLPPRVLLGLLVGLVAVVLGAAASFQSLAVRHRNVVAVTHAFASIDALAKLQAVLVDAETGERGYLLTGDERDLKPYQSAMGEAEAALASFGDLIRGDADLETSFAQLEPLVRRKLVELKQIVETTRVLGREAAIEVIRRNEGVVRMEQIRAEISRFERIERARLEERQQARTRSVYYSNAILGATSLLLVILIALATNLVRREFLEREAREAERTRLVEMQQQLMGIVGHDLRSPLSAILASAEMLLRASDVPPTRLRAVRRIIQSGKRMEWMIRDLLDYARARAGGEIPIRPRAANLSEICRRVVEELEADSRGRRVECSHRGEVTGEWDPDRLEQVISNLVSNALRHGSSQAPVKLTTEATSDRVSIEVHNEGAPIPPVLVSQLFEPFKPGTDSAGSVGLGLFIVRALVEGHGGRVEVRSPPGEGTTFHVELPRWCLGHGVSSPGPAGEQATDLSRTAAS